MMAAPPIGRVALRPRTTTTPLTDERGNAVRAASRPPQPFVGTSPVGGGSEPPTPPYTSSSDDYSMFSAWAEAGLLFSINEFINGRNIVEERCTSHIRNSTMAFSGTTTRRGRRSARWTAGTAPVHVVTVEQADRLAEPPEAPDTSLRSPSTASSGRVRWTGLTLPRHLHEALHDIASHVSG